MESPWDGRTKVCSNGPGLITKVAAMPIYGKKLQKIFFFGTRRPMTLKLGMLHRVLEYYQIYTLIFFTARSNLDPCPFVWEKDKTMKFSGTIVVCDLKLATEYRSDKKFLLTSKLCPLGAVCPLPQGYLYMY